MDPLLEAAEQEYTKRQAKRLRFDSFKVNVNTFKAHAEEFNECDTCGRRFDEGEKQAFLIRQVGCLVFPYRPIKEPPKLRCKIPTEQITTDVGNQDT